MKKMIEIIIKYWTLGGMSDNTLVNGVKSFLKLYEKYDMGEEQAYLVALGCLWVCHKFYDVNTITLKWFSELSGFSVEEFCEAEWLILKYLQFKLI